LLFKRHFSFLQTVLYYACTAFGGPNAHIGVMTKLFVQQRKDVTQQELLDFFSFCQLLPGPSSTQTITLIGYKRGGILLAILTLIIWCLPAIFLMSALSFFVPHHHFTKAHQHLFLFVQPMAIGFLCYAAWQAMRSSVNHFATYCIMFVAMCIACFVQSPWVFPLLIIIGGFVSNISNRRIEKTIAIPKKIKWVNLWMFALLFIIAGILSEVARMQHWQYARIFNLFENFYRFGSIVWGGGHSLMSVMSDQFINLPLHRGQAPYLSSQDYLTGFGMVSCVPGPVFSICSYIGGMATSGFGITYQVLGCFVASVGVFLPSLLLVLFLYPIYNNLKQHIIIFRALEGIHATVVGLMWASGIKLLAPSILQNNIQYNFLAIVTVILTFILLKFTKIPSPIIVFLSLCIGYFW
jgi:chromate transporter